MKYKVFITRQAEEDIWDIYRYVFRQDGQKRADTLLNKLEQACEKLTTFPKRGNIPSELEFIGVLEYLEVHSKPYRIIYQILDNQVFIHCVFDGRRNLQELLPGRLLR